LTKVPDRVALFTGFFGGGGIERVMGNLADGFIERGLQVDVIIDKGKDSKALQRLPSAVRVIDLDVPRLYLCLPKLIGYLQQERPVAVLSASHYVNEMALWARQLSRVPVRIVVSEHNQISQTVQHATQMKNRFTPWFARWFYPWADGIVAVSQGVAQDLAAASGLPAEAIQVIYNPVITPSFLAKAQEPLDHPWFAPGQPPVILGVGKLEQQKDFPTLIRAFAQVRDICPSRLMILGWGPDRPQLEALIRELGLTEEEVALPGYIGNPYAYMARAGLFALSSAWEGLPTVLIEAMAAGVPVVSTDCKSGPQEILNHGQYGALTPVGDHRALAEAMLEVLKGQRKTVEADWLNQFTLGAVTQRYLDILGIA
jgi:glycosyltransferase involved in cell wall biosynthesis